VPPPAYTKRLYGGTVSDTSPATAGPPPAGYIWVVICMTFTKLAATDAFLLVSVPGPLYLLSEPLSEFNGAAQIFTHQVVEPGETISLEIVADPGSCTVLLTGYELSIT